MNKKSFLKFFVVLTIIAAVLFFIYMLLVNEAIMPPAIYDLEIFLVQYAITLLIYLLLIQTLSSNAEYFVQAAILSIVVKLILYIAFIFVIIYLSPDSAHMNVVLFLSIYLIFTALAVGMLYPVINQHHKERHKQH